MIIAIFIISIIFISIAFFINENNAKDLLSGYNTMTDEERKNFNIKLYLPFFRNFHFFLGISLLTISLLLYYIKNIDWAGIFLGTYPLLAYSYFIWKSNSFNTKKSKKQNIITYSAMSLMFIILIVIIYEFNNCLKDNQIIVSNNKIEITGEYGADININDLKSILLIDNLPEISSKIHGFDLAIIKKGYFYTSNNEKVKLLINSESKPLIMITTKDNQKIYYSSNEKPNEEIYKELKSIINN